jgi:putative transposase
MSFEYKQFYRRKLPHIHSPGATLFVTFRLFGSIPKHVLAEWQRERTELELEYERLRNNPDVEPAELKRFQKELQRRSFAKYEHALHSDSSGPHWLKDPRIASEVANSMQFLNGKSYTMHAFCIMSNHVHWVFTPKLNAQSLIEVPGSHPLRFESIDPPMSAIMQSIKGYTARQANKILNRKGSFWEAESYDHEVGDSEEFGRIIRYVLNNPVKAGLVSDWRKWRWNWRAES